MRPLTTPLCQRLGTVHPVFGFSHSVDVTIALTRAGGFAVLGVARDDPDHIRRAIGAVRDAVGARPFGVDLMFPRLAGQEATVAEVQQQIPQQHRDFVDELTARHQVPAATRPTFFTATVRSAALFEAQLDAVLESDVDLVAAAVGVPPAVIARIKQRGKIALALVGSAKHAQAAIAAGVDALVAQGSDAGGHTGTVGTFSLVPQVLAVAGTGAGAVPVVAAGGVGHGSQLAAALAMGAQGVWLGTAWLATHEHALQDALVKQLLDARSEDTVITRSHSGKPCRVIESGWTREWHAPGAPDPLPMPYQQALTGPLVAAVEEHNVQSLLYTPAGQSVAWVTQREPVQAVVQRLIEQANAALRHLHDLVGTD